MMEVFNIPQYLSISLSYIFRSKDKKMPEKVLIPSMSMFSVIGMRKLSRRKIVKNMIPAELTI